MYTYQTFELTDKVPIQLLKFCMSQIDYQKL